MERFLAFCGKEYYASGGWEDFVADYSDIEEAKTEVEKYMREIFPFGAAWYHIVDQQEGKIVFNFIREYDPDDEPDESQLS
jgi:hypothetical protein